MNELELKKCNICEQQLTLDNFYTQNRKNGIYYYPRCKSCYLTTRKITKKENQESVQYTNNYYFDSIRQKNKKLREAYTPRIIHFINAIEREGVIDLRRINQLITLFQIYADFNPKRKYFKTKMTGGKQLSIMYATLKNYAENNEFTRD